MKKIYVLNIPINIQIKRYENGFLLFQAFPSFAFSRISRILLKKKTHFQGFQSRVVRFQGFRGFQGQADTLKKDTLYKKRYYIPETVLMTRFSHKPPLVEFLLSPLNNVVASCLVGEVVVDEVVDDEP